MKLDERQERVFNALHSRNDKVAGMYHTMLALLVIAPIPGNEIARASVICHCGRELMNSILEIMPDIDVSHIKPSSNSLKDKLPKLFNDVNFDIGQDYVLIPKSAAKTLHELISTINKESSRKARLEGAVITDGTDNKHPAIKQWQATHKFFMHWTHLNRVNDSCEAPSDDEIRKNLRVVEDVIETRSNLFFENFHKIEDLLTEANMVSEEDKGITSYQKPNDAQVNEAVRRALTPQLSRAFFEGLKNPLWLKPLAERQVFSNPPESKKGEDGLTYDIYWPQLDYLTCVAPKQPEQTIDILLKFSESNNTWVKRTVFTIGSRISAHHSVRLKPLLNAWYKSKTGFGYRSDPREMVDLTVNLLSGGEHNTGIWLADILFRPRKPANDDTSPYLREPILFIGEDWYNSGLPKVIAKLTAVDLKRVARWLYLYECYSGRFIKTSDITYIARESIEQDEVNIYATPEQALIDGTRDLAVRAVVADPAASVKILLSKNMVLERKIALYSVAKALGQAELTPTQVRSLLMSAQGLLFDNKSRVDACRIEYGELGRAVAKRNESLLVPLTEFLKTGPCIEPDVLRQRLRQSNEDTPEQLEERLSSYISRWKHRWLAAIGIDALPDNLKFELADLDNKLGVIKNPLAPSQRITTWTGPNSPIGKDEMATLSPTELVIRLESWHADSNVFGPAPSHEGQGRILSELLTANPLAISCTTHLIEHLRPTYLRAILQGWEGAVKAGIAPDWNQVVEVISDVLGHEDASSFLTEGDNSEDDSDYRGAKRAAVDLLVELVEKRDKDSKLVPKPVISQFADLLIDSACNTAAWSEYKSYDNSNNGMDPLTMSLNWEWPTRFRGLLSLMTYGPDTTWYEQDRAAVEYELSRSDPHGASRAVLGERFGRLLDSDPNWIMPRITMYFGGKAGISFEQQIALTTTMATHYYNVNIFNLLTPSMISAIHLTKPIAAGWKSDHEPLERIGEWVIDALIFGEKTMRNSVVSAFFTDTSPENRGKAMGQIAWSFMNSASVDTSIRDRFGRLWDKRIKHVQACPEDKAELNQFYWIVRSNKFEPKWWLPRLEKVIELDSDFVVEDFTIGKELAAAASTNPRAAFRIFKTLMPADSTKIGMRVWDLTQYAPTIIAPEF